MSISLSLSTYLPQRACATRAAESLCKIRERAACDGFVSLPSPPTKLYRTPPVVSAYSGRFIASLVVYIHLMSAPLGARGRHMVLAALVILHSARYSTAVHYLDDDGDGVPNYKDVCPNTPPLTRVSANLSDISNHTQLCTASAAVRDRLL